MPTLTDLRQQIIDWFDENARDLPWRRPEAGPWGVMVSEFMLQQTPVIRVLPVWEKWMQLWPTPADLAQASTADVLREWGRLGYPRRALRLHEAAKVMTEKYAGQVPDNHADLLALPGVGAYTAAAISSFAFGIPEVVVDTNIRRVHARAITGKALPSKSFTVAEMRLAEEVHPAIDSPAGRSQANRWNAAAMELGALVCTARSPQCDTCPILELCAWVRAGKPEADYVPKGQSWAGTDRQLRGAIMAVLRAQHRADPLEIRDVVLGSNRLGEHVPDEAQWQRCFDGLVKDGLAVHTADGYELPA